MPLLVEALAEARLQASPYPSIPKVKFRYDDRVLLLRGHVPNRVGLHGCPPLAESFLLAPNCGD